MYIYKDVHSVQREHRRATQAADRFEFHDERYGSVKYKNSPYYKGSELWDKLPQETINIKCLFELKKCRVSMLHMKMPR